MAWKFNPFTGTLDYSGGGGGGASYIDGEVEFHADLPVAVGVPPVDSVYIVRKGSGVWLINRKPAGIYVRSTNNGNLDDWTYAGILPDVFSDANFTVYNAADSSKQVKLDASAVSASTVRTLTIPDKDGTLALTSDIDITIDTSLADLLTSTSGTLSADDLGSDQIYFWDDSESKAQGLAIGTGLEISGTTLSADIKSDPTGVTGADAISNIISLTQAEYDAIVTPDAATLYIITD